MAGDKTALVYVLHFTIPYWQAAKAKCQHYIGYTTKPVGDRLAKHRAGKGSRLVLHAIAKGIPFRLVYLETGLSRHEARIRELQIKGRGAPRYCCKCLSKGVM